jgi:hypothetical protein
MQVRVRATTSGGQDVMTRRDFGVAVYTAGVGGSYDDPSGGKLRMDARTASRDMLVVSREVVSATRPEGAALVQTAGPRWVLDAPRERWSGTAELSLPFDREVVPAGAESGVAIWQQLEEEWVRLDSRVDAEKGLVQAEISGAGTFAVFYEPAGGVSDLLPTRTALGANYPNPFNPTTTIPFDLAVTSEVKLSVYNVLGQQVATLVSDLQGAGRHHVVWNGRDRFDRQVASGVYFYRIETKPVDGSAGIVQTRKLVLMR